MKRQPFVESLSLIRHIHNRNAISPLYRSLQIGPDGVRAVASFAALEIASPTELTETVCVDTNVFLAVLMSLPDIADLRLTVANGVLEFRCGQAHGRMATVVVNETFPPLPIRRVSSGLGSSADLAKALELGAISCGGSALSTIGTYGVVLDSRGEGLRVMSSDNATVACCSTAVTHPGLGALRTLPPEGSALLAACCRRQQGILAFDENSIFYQDAGVRAMIRHVTPLSYDIASVLDTYAEAEVLVPIERGRIDAFIRRATALAETRQHAYVDIGATSGRLTLAFSEGLATAEEYYLVEGLEMPDVRTVRLDAVRLARALSHTDSLVLDHMDRRVIMLRGKSPPFAYLIAGRMMEDNT